MRPKTESTLYVTGATRPVALDQGPRACSTVRPGLPRRPATGRYGKSCNPWARQVKRGAIIGSVLGIGTAALVRADPRNPVYAAYLGGATATRAVDAWMLWFFGASLAF